MAKLWAGRTQAQVDKLADDFNSSIRFDSAMYAQDIQGSAAHAAMLGSAGIISAQDCSLIIEALGSIREDIDSGALVVDAAAEDIHMFIEEELTRRIGDAGKRLHTARSRNDQVAVDIRLYLREQTDEVIALVYKLLEVIYDKADEHKGTIMPGYTHMQRAQPVTFGHHLLAYACMLMRDIGRLKDARGRMNYSPLGSAALAGTTYPIDREATARALGFTGVMSNSMDGVSDRDFCVELTAALSLLMTHLSRFAEEVILWASWEFKFIELSDSYSTGSSIMPQKKNPDMAELVRGKTGRVYGDLVTLLTMLKGLPLAYNKDMQEDKEAVFDAFDTVKMCLGVFAPMLATASVIKENMANAAAAGFINATDCADYLVKKGMPFRTAYKITGELVAQCISTGCVLQTLELKEYKKHSEVFAQDIYEAIKLEECVKRRISAGSTGYDSVQAQLVLLKEFLDERSCG